MFALMKLSYAHRDRVESGTVTVLI